MHHLVLSGLIRIVHDTFERSPKVLSPENAGSLIPSSFLSADELVGCFDYEKKGFGVASGFFGGKLCSSGDSSCCFACTCLLGTGDDGFREEEEEKSFTEAISLSLASTIIIKSKVHARSREIANEAWTSSNYENAGKKLRLLT